MKLYVLAFIFALSGCVSGVKPANPQQAVIQIEFAFKDAVAVAAAYDSLPSCTTAVTLVCSNTAVARQLKSAKDTAQLAINSAETAVRDPKFAAGGVSAAVVAAQAAVAALTAITTLEAVQTAVKGGK